MPLGAQAADTVLARIAGTQPAAVNQAFTGQCISLGRGAGTIQSPAPTTRRCRSTSAAAPRRMVKEAVCKGTVSVLRREARKPGSYRWLKGGKRPAAGSTRPLCRGR